MHFTIKILIKCFRKEELTTEKSSANFEDKKDFFSRYVVTPRTDYEEKSPIPFNLTIYKVSLLFQIGC